MKHLLLSCMFVALLAFNYASAQSPCADEAREYPASACPTSGSPWTTHNTPLMDGNSGLNYGDSDNNIVSLYGSYGNTEQTPGPALNHYNYGIAQGDLIVPRVANGNSDSNGKIVFPFLERLTKPLRTPSCSHTC
jgi:hypothetical protein